MLLLCSRELPANENYPAHTFRFPIVLLLYFAGSTCRQLRLSCFGTRRTCARLRHRRARRPRAFSRSRFMGGYSLQVWGKLQAGGGLLGTDLRHLSRGLQKKAATNVQTAVYRNQARESFRRTQARRSALLPHFSGKSEMHPRGHLSEKRVLPARKFLSGCGHRRTPLKILEHALAWRRKKEKLKEYECASIKACGISSSYGSRSPRKP